MKIGIPPHTLKVLEFDAVRTMCSERTVSAPGHRRAMSLEPGRDVVVIGNNLQTVTEMRGFLDQAETVPLRGIKDIGGALERAGVAGARMEPQTLLDMADTLRVSRRMRAFGQRLRNRSTAPHVGSLTAGLGDFQEIENSIGQAIDGDGNIRDHASPGLRRIRTDQQTMRERARNWLQRFIQSEAGAKALQEPVITMRDGRYVVPVRMDHRGQVQGVVHDQSASGATVFIEPIGVVEFNNRLRELIVAEGREIERILLSLTDQVHQQVEAITVSYGLLGQLDFFHAAAVLSIDLRAAPPRLNTDGHIVLRNARHPILELSDQCETVVPLNLQVGESAQTLVITGPNMGGKTVALKSIGILTMMAQSGLHIPADDDTEIAVFDSIFADIGDEQSIEANLSTFSAHLVHIRTILEEADDHTLVLLDELGAGTDPSAGSAMGMAILESLTQRGTVTAATTHFDTLKAFATRTAGVENGSMIFDVETLTPSYQFRQGIPGASYALEIGSRLGMPGDVLERASRFMGNAEKRLDEVIMEVDRKHELLVAAQEQADRLRAELDGLKRTYEDQIASYRQKERDTIAAGREKMDRLLKDAQAAIDQAVAAVRREQAAAGAVEASRKTVGDQRARLQRMLDTIDSASSSDGDAGEAAADSTGAAADSAGAAAERAGEAAVEPSVNSGTGPAREAISAGDEVWVASLGQAGSVIQVQGDRLRIRTGRMEITARRSEVRLHKPDPAPSRGKPAGRVEVRMDRPRAALTELDVRGFRAGEAIDAVDRYIDQTTLDDLNEIRILHGKGTGALSSAIQEFLQHHPLVKSSHFAEQRDGGTGVTIVEMKD
ncbi:MAG: endonuclease MutS2 [Gemmatimonadetes bacterium]|nr:endonuclease MutS2 [Gemmatimonadota bacterium]MYB62127.1 endonuclease MutS2 [Gemmatimonadota bacterium]